MNTPGQCHRCQKPMQAEDAQEVAVEQGTSASQIYIHRDGCAVQSVRRTA